MWLWQMRMVSGYSMLFDLIREGFPKNTPSLAQIYIDILIMTLFWKWKGWNIFHISFNFYRKYWQLWSSFSSVIGFNSKLSLKLQLEKSENCSPPYRRWVKEMKTKVWGWTKEGENYWLKWMWQNLLCKSESDDKRMFEAAILRG